MKYSAIAAAVGLAFLSTASVYAADEAPKTEISGAYVLPQPEMGDAGVAKEGQIAYKADSQPVTVKGISEEGNTLATTVDAQWKSVFEATGTGEIKVSNLDSITLDINNPARTYNRTDGENTDAFQSGQPSVDAIHATYGGKVTFSNIGDLNISITTAKVGYPDDINFWQDPIALHAMGGTIGINAKGSVTINMVNDGNAVMVQNSSVKSGAIEIKAAEAIRITSNTGTVMVGAIVADNNTTPTTQASASLTLDAPVIEIVSNAVPGPDQKAAISVYDNKYTNDGRVAGTASLTINTQHLLLKSSYGSGLFVNKQATGGDSKSEVKITSTGSATFEGTQSGIRVAQVDNKNKVTNEMTITSPVINITSTGTADDSQAFYQDAKTEVTFNVGEGQSEGVVNISAANGQAIESAGKLNAQNTTLNVQKGSVAFSTDEDSTAELSLTNATLKLAEGSTATLNKLTGSDATVVFNDMKEGVVTIADNQVSNLSAFAGSAVTAKLGSAEAVLEQYKQTKVVDIKKTTGNDAATAATLSGGENSALTSGWKIVGDQIVYDNGSAQSAELSATRHANAANMAQWRYEVNHVSDRLGQVRNGEGSIGTWARVYGGEAKVSDTVSTKVKATSLQVGADVRVNDNWIVGAAFGYTDSDSEFTTGGIDTDSYNLAVYGTANFACGGYVDMIARMGFMDSDVDMTTGYNASYDNAAIGLSAEVGYRWDLTDMFYVTPQAELSYSFVNGDDYTASNGVKIEQDNFDSLVGRIGVQAGANFADNAGSVYLTASVNHEFLGETKATATQGANAAQHLTEDLDGTWVSYGVGAQFNATDRMSFYGSLTRANGSDYQENYRYSVGMRYVW
ncbi:MAG: autotransporter outer membrane beta-barrel domain-containing protein [Sutterellaceae bacterium]|nr:autotransporter outer membrane beta-barrel domain-containing protein [Sutterellaceae bacterium]